MHRHCPDEATANVDPENEEALMQAIQAHRDKTIIMIAHRLKTVEHADQILVLDQGAVLSQSKVQTLKTYWPNKVSQQIYSRKKNSRQRWRINT